MATNTQATQPSSTPSGASKGVQASQLSLPKGGGALQSTGEKVAVQAYSGSSSYSLPIAATPCREMTPSLAVSYSTGAGNGPFGLGWSFSLPQITRKTTKGIPTYGPSDTFLLSSGEDLVPLDGQAREETIQGTTYSIEAYGLRQEGSFSLIEYWKPLTGEIGRHPFWRVVDRDHTISIFGFTSQAIIRDPADPRRIFAWLLEESYTPTGDHQLLLYKAEDSVNVPSHVYERNRSLANRYIERICYGNHEPLADSMLFTSHPAIEDRSQWHFELVFDYGEYQIDPMSTTPYRPANTWSYREDAYSSYQQGFEVRTLRRCSHTLLFHRFAELGSEPVLTRATAYRYSYNKARISELVGATILGYNYDPEVGYTVQALPETLFTYSGLGDPPPTFMPLIDTAGKSLSGLNETSYYSFIDLFGAGRPGIFYSDGGSTYYREPLQSPPSGEVAYQATSDEVRPLYTHQEARNSFLETTVVPYGPWGELATFPSSKELHSGEALLLDLTGQGYVDVVVHAPYLQGYWQAKPDGTFQDFRPFTNYPLASETPGWQLVDMNGTGLADLVQIQDKEVVVVPSRGKEGYGQPLVVQKEATLPSLTQTSLTQDVRFAAMDGSGRSHLVKIQNGKISYWPSLGYGQFGKEVVMANAPRIPDLDVRRLFLVDIDGTGTSDLVYVYKNKIALYLNQNGNQFSDPIEIPLPIAFDEQVQLSFADVMGRGTTCLLLSDPKSSPSGRPRHWYYDFCKGEKPYLLTGTRDQMGARSEITYGSSVDFYLADQAADMAWVTHVPFPVHVVTQLTQVDEIADARYVTQYAYHHGYYDGEEREFRGFGRIDQQDSAYFSGLEPGDPSYTAPALMRSWYHTGAPIESLREQYTKEFYQGDPAAFALSDPAIDWGSLDPATQEQGWVALAGTLLRSELYGLDTNSQPAQHPYSVSESSSQLRVVQAKGDNRYAIFLLHPHESLVYNYERSPEDPHMSQTCVLQVDAYGNIEESCALAYPRRQVAGALPQQQQLKVTCATKSYVNQVDPATYLLGAPIESQSYEITTLQVSPGTKLSFEELLEGITAALATLSSTTPSSQQAILLGWERAYYGEVDATGNNTTLPLGGVILPLLLAEQWVAEFSKEQVAAALEGALGGEDLQDQLIKGYYQLDTLSNYWWNPGLTAQYGSLAQFYLPTATIDPAGNKTSYTYDLYHLLMVEVVDALENVVKVEAIDYHHLYPTRLLDLNGNTSEVKLDPLGRVVYTSHYGQEAGQAVGFAPLLEAPPLEPDSIEAVLESPSLYLGNTQSYFYYDDFAFKDRGEPLASLSLVAEAYPGDPGGRILVQLSYYDGMGRTLASKAQVEAGDAFLYDPLTQEITQGYTPDRWLTSGRVVYDNKGNPIKQYEPYFIDTPSYVPSPVLDTFGVTPIIYYDPLGKVPHTITAKGFLLRKEWTPWEVVAHDSQDTLTISPYCQVNALKIDEASLYYDPSLSPSDRIALAAAIEEPENPNLPQPSTALGRSLVYGLKYFQDTPSRSILDNLGQKIQTSQINKSKDMPAGETLTSYASYDILGRQLASADPRLQTAGKYNFETTYSLTGDALKQISADAGTRWGLTNIFGNPIWSCDGRGITITPSYDALQRVVEVHVKKTATGNDPLILDQIVERRVYGDTPGATTSPEENNLRGKLYKHYDQAGLVTIPSYSLLGAPFSSQREFSVGYKGEANWDDISPSTLETLLQSQMYVEQSTYDALGRVKEAIDVDGNITVPSYHISGRLDQLAVTTASDDQTKQVVEGISYNAKGQRLSIGYGNTTSTSYTYDPKTFELARLTTTSASGSRLQDLVYVYDPQGNVVAKTDQGQSAVYYNNQTVNPTASYIYDSLYRLIEGSGREKIGNAGGEDIRLPHASDNTALQNYIEKYTYDLGSNLVKTQHIAQSQDSWTREMVVATTSNRAVISTIRGEDGPAPRPEEVNQYFDASGNQIQTQAVHPLAWNYRNNLQQATVIVHADGREDAEYYVYDGGGKRVRKVKEQYGNGGETIIFHETLYLGGVEYRRTLQGTELETAAVLENYHSLRVMDSEEGVATKDYWLVGTPPTGISNNYWRYHLNDYLGSCSVEVDGQGNQISYEEYSSFGASLLFIGTGSASQLKHYRYSGKERDSATGFYYYGARYYAPWLARWLAPDPSGTVDGLNLYAFVTNNPETFWDEQGMSKTNTGGPTNTSPIDQNHLETASSSSTSSSLDSSSSSSSSGRTIQVGINSSKMRMNRVMQRITKGTRNILTMKYNIPSTGSHSKKIIYLSMVSLGMGNTKLTMPAKKGDERKRGHTEGLAYAIMQQGKVTTGGTELELKNEHIEYISSTNEACSGKGSESCKTELVGKMLGLASQGSKFYYNNAYVTGQDTSTAGGFSKSTNKHFNGNDASEPESEEEGEFYVVEQIPDDKKDRSIDSPSLLEVKPLDKVAFMDSGVLKTISTKKPGTLEQSAPQYRKKYTRKNGKEDYNNKGALFKVTSQIAKK